MVSATEGLRVNNGIIDEPKHVGRFEDCPKGETNPNPLEAERIVTGEGGGLSICENSELGYAIIIYGLKKE